MKKRIVKKYAKRYLTTLLNGGLYLPFGYRIEEYRVYNDGTPPVTKYIANFPLKIRREIHKTALKSGWDGCHWTDPLLLAVDDTDQVEYEKEFHPPHLW